MVPARLGRADGARPSAGHRGNHGVCAPALLMQIPGCWSGLGFRSNKPVRRHSRDNWTKWPADRVSLSNAYPDAQEFDVRIMGGSQTRCGLGRHPTELARL